MCWDCKQLRVLVLSRRPFSQVDVGVLLGCQMLLLLQLRFQLVTFKISYQTFLSYKQICFAYSFSVENNSQTPIKLLFCLLLPVGKDSMANIRFPLASGHLSIRIDPNPIPAFGSFPATPQAKVGVDDVLSPPGLSDLST